MICNIKSAYWSTVIEGMRFYEVYSKFLELLRGALELGAMVIVFDVGHVFYGTPEWNRFLSV